MLIGACNPMLCPIHGGDPQVFEMGLFHGWVVDPNDRAAAEAVGSTSYNQLVEIVIHAQYAQGQASNPVVQAQIERGRVYVALRTLTPIFTPQNLKIPTRIPLILRPGPSALAVQRALVNCRLCRPLAGPLRPNLMPEPTTLGPRIG